MRHTKVVVAAIAVVCMAAPALGVGYVELVSRTNVEAGGTGNRTWSHAIDGETAYIAVNGFSSQGFAPNITKVEILGGAQAASVLYTNVQWGAASGATTLTAGHGFGVSGTNLMWTDTSTDAIWKGALDGSGISSYVTKAQIQAFTGGSNASSGNGNTIAPDGEFVWFESTSDGLLKTTGAGTMTTLVPEADLLTLHQQTAGSATIVSGMAHDSNDTLYWATSTSTSSSSLRPGGLYSRASDGTLGTVLTAAEIIAVSGHANKAGFGDISYGPDGLLYFYESQMDNIMRFDASDAANSLEIYVSEAELLAGDMGSDNVVNLDWYDGNLTFHTFQVGTNMASPLFVVPEPAALSLLAFGGLALLRRRR